MDLLVSPLAQAVALGAVLLVVLTLANRRYQRCPHCRRWVGRAHRGWLRCRGCGRQYHRSVHLKR